MMENHADVNVSYFIYLIIRAIELGLKVDTLSTVSIFKKNQGQSFWYNRGKTWYASPAPL